MPLVVNPNNINGLVDLSEAINVIPNQWGLINRLGLFESERKSLKTVEIPRITWNEGLIPDRNWDERNNANRGPSRSYLTAPIPHFPLDDYITPNDVDGKVAFTEIYAGSQVETVAATRARKMMGIRMNHALTLEAARAQLITTGSVYAPSGTLATSYGSTINWYNEFGVTRTEVGLPLNDETTNPIPLLDPIIAGVQDGMLSGVITDEFIGLASPAFFNALIGHPYVNDAIKYQPMNLGGATSQDILVGRPRSSLGANYREVSIGGIRWIEYRGNYTDRNTGVVVPFIPSGDAYVFPRTSDVMFKTFFAPANRFDTINTVAQEAYFYEYMGEKQDKIEIMTESNFLNFVGRPQAIVRVYISA